MLTELRLTPLEQRILDAFADHIGEWLPRIIVVRLVYPNWHDQHLTEFDMHTLRTHVWRLRRKLEPTPWRIETHYGHGLYRLVGPHAHG